MTASALIPFAGPADLVQLDTRLPAVFLTYARASECFSELFAVNIRNKNTRRAYYKAASRNELRCLSIGTNVGSNPTITTGSCRPVS
jgi:hypothetical protein